MRIPGNVSGNVILRSNEPNTGNADMPGKLPTSGLGQHPYNLRPGLQAALPRRAGSSNDPGSKTLNPRSGSSGSLDGLPKSVQMHFRRALSV